MELYKVKDNELIKFKGGFVVLDNHIYTNPTEEVIRKAGYKDLFYDEQPEYNADTQYLAKEIEELETAIKVHWLVQEILIEE